MTVKPTVWSRWTATIQADNPAQLADELGRYLQVSERFTLRDVGVDDNDKEPSTVRLVVEYRAIGANRNDVQRRLTKLGIDASRVTIRQSIALDLDDPANTEAARALGLVVDEAEEVAESSYDEQINEGEPDEKALAAE